MRYNNYDLLRCFCLLGVFCLHLQRDSIVHQCAACLGTMSVPCFFMLSGAFTMTNNKISVNRMRKTCRKLIIPWMWAIILYLAEGFFFQYLHTRHIDIGIEINSLLTYGYPTRGWHLWYMYALTEMYLIIPLFKRLKEANIKIYYIAGLLLLIVSCPISLPWYLRFIKYIGLYIAGDFIFSYGSNLKRRGKIIVCGVLPLSISGVLAANVAGVELYNIGLITAVAELSIMLFFSNIHIKLILYPVTRYFMMIYIMHIIVGDFWSGVSRFIHLDGINAWWMLVVDCCVVFIGCYLLCICREYLCRNIIKKIGKK